MVDPSTGAGIVFNGEIYNFRELRQRLLSEGVHLGSNSDTEVVLQLMLRIGPSALQLFEGMFALAIWKPNEGELFIARDRLGVKPLYYSREAGVMTFASELRALLAGGVSNTLSPRGVDSFLRFGAPREPDTILASVEELPAGSWLAQSSSGIVEGMFWSAADGARTGHNGVEANISFQEAASKVQSLLYESVRLRLVSDVPVVTFLSGGLDSSCLVAAVRHVTGSSPATIGVTFRERAYSEAEAIRTLVDHFECRHVNYELSDGALLDLIPHAVSNMDQPTVDGINTFVVSKVAAERGFKVALSGIGGDELFGGYRSFRAVPLLNRTKRILSGRFGHSLAAAAALGLPAGERRKKIRQWFLTDRPDGDAYDLVRELFSIDERGILLGVSSSQAQPDDAQGSRQTFSDISWRELSEYMRNILLRDTDCFGMACSLEIREPYLHTPLVEFMLALPDKLKARKPSKALLRGAFGPLLPESILRSPKHGFVLPFGLWLLGGPLHEDVETMLLATDSRSILDQPAVQKVWADFQAGRTSWNRVWALYVLRQWCAQHLTAATVAAESLA